MTRHGIARYGAGAVALGALLLAPVSAWAHAVLVSSSPSMHGVVGKGALHVRLKFNSRVDGKRSTLMLEDAQHATRALVLTGQSGADALDADAGVLAPGAYTLRWQALASDGHITRGQIPFAVR